LLPPTLDELPVSAATLLSAVGAVVVEVPEVVVSEVVGPVPVSSVVEVLEPLPDASSAADTSWDTVRKSAPKPASAAADTAATLALTRVSNGRRGVPCVGFSGLVVMPATVPPHGSGRCHRSVK
jgi:hypothetical protein